MTSKDTVAQLNEFLRGELSAVETYQIAIERPELPVVRNELVDCQKSHADRAELLRARIRELGGTPVASSGAWGTVAKALEAGASKLGDHLAIAVLEEGEDHRLHDYEADLSALDEESRSLVTLELLPEQRRTHRTMSSMKMAMH
jgi:demethoxyubiquinone hydroxylase (CLK1/Coq7/Cat5 family)